MHPDPILAYLPFPRPRFQKSCPSMEALLQQMVPPLPTASLAPCWAGARCILGVVMDVLGEIGFPGLYFFFFPVSQPNWKCKLWAGGAPAFWQLVFPSRDALDAECPQGQMGAGYKLVGFAACWGHSHGSQHSSAFPRHLCHRALLLAKSSWLAQAEGDCTLTPAPALGWLQGGERKLLFSLGSAGFPFPGALLGWNSPVWSLSGFGCLLGSPEGLLPVGFAALLGKQQTFWSRFPRA